MRGGMSRLERIVRRLADLYEWCAANSVELENDLMRGGHISPQLILRALQDAAVSEAHVDHLQNDRISVWLEFLRFAVVPDNWQSGRHEKESDESRARRRAYVDDLSRLLAARRIRAAVVTSHQPLSKLELDAIDYVLGVESQPIFSAKAAARNKLLFRVVRWTGARIGEVLKLKAEDVPNEPSIPDRILASISGQPQLLKIRRRPDDPDDGRRREPRVKRGNREVPIPDELCSDMRKHLAKRRSGTSQYVFLSSTDEERPLSQSRAEKIIKTLGRHADLAFKFLHPTEESTLRDLCWHRLRTTRAVELAFRYFPDGKASEYETLQFIRHFGWASIRSAAPYISTMRDRSATEMRFRIMEDGRAGN